LSISIDCRQEAIGRRQERGQETRFFEKTGFLGKKFEKGKIFRIAVISPRTNEQ